MCEREKWEEEQEEEEGILRSRINFNWFVSICQQECIILGDLWMKSILSDFFQLNFFTQNAPQGKISTCLKSWLTR